MKYILKPRNQIVTSLKTDNSLNNPMYVAPNSGGVTSVINILKI